MYLFFLQQLSKVKGAGKLKQPVVKTERHDKERQKERSNTAVVESRFKLNSISAKLMIELPILPFMVLSIQEVVASLLSRVADKYSGGVTGSSVVAVQSLFMLFFQGNKKL